MNWKTFFSVTYTDAMVNGKRAITYRVGVFWFIVLVFGIIGWIV